MIIYLHTDEITARALDYHLQSAQTAHLCMIVKRLKEVQGVVSTQQQGLRALEATSTEHQHAIVALTAGAATAAAALKVQDGLPLLILAFL